MNMGVYRGSPRGPIATAQRVEPPLVAIVTTYTARRRETALLAAVLRDIASRRLWARCNYKVIHSVPWRGSPQTPYQFGLHLSFQPDSDLKLDAPSIASRAPR